ncbi:MAG TPA: DUF3592 domain-containing protein [Allosphingosinicella sp.]|jgi:hypothetical protein
MDWVGFGLIALGLVWSAAFAFAHFRAAGKAKAAETWPTAIATIHSCSVVEEESTNREGHTSTWYNPVVAYSYAVAGREYQSQRLRFGNYRSGSRKKAEAMLAPYSATGNSTVRYNPERPEECVLETRRPGPIYLIMAVFGLLFVGMGLFWGSMSA